MLMEKKKETIIVGLYRDYRSMVFKGYIGIMEKKMETTIMGYTGIIGV